MALIVYFLLALIVVLLVLYVVKLQNLEKKTNTPGPGFFKNTIQNITKGPRSVFQTSLKWLQDNKITEGFAHFWLGPLLAIAAVDADAAKFVLKSHDIEKGRGNQLSKYFTNRFGEHLVAVNGDVWRKQRAVVNFAFTSKAYQAYHPTFLEMTNKVIKKIGELSAGRKDVDVAGLMSRFTLDLLGSSVFHHDFASMDGKFDEYYQDYKFLISNIPNIFFRFVPIFDYLPTEHVKRYHAAVDKISSLFHKLIEEHRKNNSANDILDHMLAAADDPVNGLSATELYSNIWIFFIAGHETTALALTTAAYELSLHPEIQEKLFLEISSVVGDQTPSLELINNLKYLDCFINENLRMHPPVRILPNRRAIKDLHYKDQIIPQGCSVGVHIEAIHNNPKYWPEPQKFDPDRFLPENKKGRHNFAFLPFLLGPRMCIGNDFSLNEQRLCLTELIRNYKVLPPKVAPTWTNISDVLTLVGQNRALDLQFVPRNKV